jgi:ribonucleotide monophosphatase NagD (HAD superfamily)
MGQAAGAVSVLVLTGETTAAQAAKAARPPDFVLESVKQLGELLHEAQAVAV